MSFYIENRSIMLMFHVFSLSPFGFTNNERLCLKLLSFGSLLLILTVVSSAIFITGFIRQNSLQAVVGALLLVAELVTHLFIIIQSYVTRHQQLQIVRNITYIDDQFGQQLSVNIPYDKLWRRYQCRTFGILVVLALVIIGNIIYMALRNDEYLLKFACHMVYSMVLIRVRCIQNIFYVDLLKERLQWLADKIHSLAKTNYADQNGMAIIVNTNKNETYARQKIKYSELMSLKRIYGKIWDTNCLLNDCFGWSLLAIVTHNFIHLTSHGYWLFLALSGMLPSYQIIDSILDISTVFYVMSLLCISCYQCTQNVKIHKYIIFALIYFKHFNQIKYRVQQLMQ